MPSSFKVFEHTLPGQHVRENPGSLQPGTNADLQIAIKQYVPHGNIESMPADAVTILGVPANGFPAEVYEPLWEEMYELLRARKIAVRGFWMADSTSQAASGVLNESIQGDDVNWFDHSRDLLLMVNHFRREMPQPIIGMAHSMGGAQLVRLSIMHPKLLAGVMLYEPIILSVRAATQGGYHPSLLATIRRDLWPNRAEAEAALSKGFKKFDPRVLSLYLKHGLRSVPTALYKPGDPLPSTSRSKSGADKTSSKEADNAPAVIPSTAVTLTTTKAHEAWAFARLNPDPENATLDRIIRPEWDRTVELPRRSSRSEVLWAMRELPHLRPRTLFVFGSQSPFADELDQAEKMEITGTSWGGSGGVEAGMVKKVVVPGAGHLVPLEQVMEAAEVGAQWIGEIVSAWLEDERVVREYRSGKSVGMKWLSKEWMETVKRDANLPRLGREKL